MISSALLYVAAVFVSSVAQIILKTAANDQTKKGIKAYLNIRVIAGYGLFFGATLLTTIALKIIPLSLGSVLETAGYVFVPILSRIFLKERINSKSLIGYILIVAGIIVFTLN